MSRVFTVATDDAVIEMIRGARTRLAVIAPGVTTSVAEALAERMRDMPALSLTVILDAEEIRRTIGQVESLMRGGKEGSPRTSISGSRY